MGAAVLITLGVLFLLEEFHVFPFRESFPVLLIVIGLFLYMGRSASTEDHIEPYTVSKPVPPPPPPAANNQHSPEVNP
jgi:hypothetical protein